MSLPFLNPKKIASVIIAHQIPTGEIEDDGEEGETPSELMSASEALLSAIATKDATATSQALKSAFEFLKEKE